MTPVDSIILGIVEGLTEYLPVSSTGHLIITSALLKLPHAETQKAFEVCIQGGAILAVASLYYQRIKSIILGLLGKDPSGFRLFRNLIVAFLPAAIVGLTFGDLIKKELFGIWPVIVAWVVGGIAILIYTRSREKEGKGSGGLELDQLSTGKALAIGLIQCVAMWPGTSRSLMTILGGMFTGLSLAAAVEFSFILGFVTLGAASCHDAVKHGSDMLAEFGAIPLILGTLASWLSAVIAVKWMVGFLQKHSFAIFGWYRIAVGVIAIGLAWAGIITQ